MTLPSFVRVPTSPPTELPDDRLWWMFGIHTGLDLGTTPGPSFVLGASVGLRLHPVVVRLRGSYLFGSDRRLAARPGVGGAFDLWRVTPQFCLTPWRQVAHRGARAIGDMALDGCVAMEVGQLQGRGFGVRNPGAGTALWLTPRLGAQWTFTLTEWLSGSAGLGIGVPALRNNFVLERVGAVHRASAVGGRGELGVAAVF